MTFSKGRRFAWLEIAPTPRRVHCVRQQCFHQKKMRFSFQAPRHKRRANQTVVTSANIPDVRVPDCRRSFDGWAEETLAEPHHNKALGCHDSYLRGIWHLRSIWIEVSISDGANWGVHESSKDFAITCHILSFSVFLFSSFLFLFVVSCRRSTVSTKCIKRERVIIVMKLDLPTFQLSPTVSWLWRANKRINYDSEFMLFLIVVLALKYLTGISL